MFGYKLFDSSYFPVYSFLAQNHPYEVSYDSPRNPPTGANALAFPTFVLSQSLEEKNLRPNIPEMKIKLINTNDHVMGFIAGLSGRFNCLILATNSIK